MQKLRLHTAINATKEKIWEVLWNIHCYETWTTVFAEGSTVKTDQWKEGTRIYFVDENGAGMVSEVAAHRPNEFMSFRHLGMINNGIEDTSSEKVKAWAGSLENYTLSSDNDHCVLTLEMDIAEEYSDYFTKTWPLALEKIKGLAEGSVKPVITFHAAINAPVEKVWKAWTQPEQVMQWNHASDDWHCPAASVDLRDGGNFSFTMAAKDGSFSFDFAGVYQDVKENDFIGVLLGDGRFWKTTFKTQDGGTRVTERFETEQMNSLELQQGGWQAILNNFKKHVESN